MCENKFIILDDRTIHQRTQTRKNHFNVNFVKRNLISLAIRRNINKVILVKTPLNVTYVRKVSLKIVTYWNINKFTRGDEKSLLHVIYVKRCTMIRESWINMKLCIPLWSNINALYVKKHSKLLWVVRKYINKDIMMV